MTAETPAKSEEKTADGISYNLSLPFFALLALFPGSPSDSRHSVSERLSD